MLIFHPERDKGSWVLLFSLNPGVWASTQAVLKKTALLWCRHVTQTWNTTERLRKFLFPKQSRKSRRGLTQTCSVSSLNNMQILFDCRTDAGMLGGYKLKSLRTSTGSYSIVSFNKTLLHVSPQKRNLTKVLKRISTHTMCLLSVWQVGPRRERLTWDSAEGDKHEHNRPLHGHWLRLNFWQQPRRVSAHK